MPQQLLIDGYNLMHAALPLLGLPPALTLEQKRTSFLAALAGELNTQTRQRTTIIFDAQQTGQTYATRQQHQAMTILFPDAETDADSVIEDMIARSHGPKSLLVISSDHRIQKAARRRGASFLDSRQFALAIFEDAVPHPSMSPSPTTGHSSPSKPIPSHSQDLPPDLQSALDEALSQFLPPKLEQ